MPPSSTTLEREKRALALLRMLREDVRNSLIESLPDELQTRLRKRINEDDRKIPSARQQKQILDEFESLFTYAVRFAGPKLRVFEGSDEEDDHRFEEPQVRQYKLTGNTQVDLEKMNVYQISAALEEEAPRTVALLLRNLSPARVASVLSELSISHRSAVVREMASVDKTFQGSSAEKGEDSPGGFRPGRSSATLLLPELFEKIAAKTIQRAAQMPNKKQESVDPIIRLADVFRVSEKPLRREYLNAIEEQDPERAADLQRQLYRFDDLIELSDRQVQQILSRIDSDTLQNALKDAEPEILDKVMKNLSRRAASTLKEELSYQRPVSDALQQAARAMIAETIGLVEEEGES